MRTPSALLLALLLPASPARAQAPNEVLGTVELLDPQGRPLATGANVTVRIVEAQSSDVTNSSGFFRISIPAYLQSGHRITFRVEKPGYVIYEPHSGLERVPADPRRDHITLRLIARGSRLLMSEAEIALLVQRSVEEERERHRQSRPESPLGSQIRRWATDYGFSAQEVEEEVRRWAQEIRERSEDDYTRGLAAFAENQFREAATQFAESGEQNERALAQALRRREVAEREERLLRERVVRDRRLEGDALLSAEDPRAALAAYEKALPHARRASEPLLWAEVQNAVGIAYRALSNTSEGPEIEANLLRSLASYEQALEVYTETGQHDLRAWTQSLRAHALSGLSFLHHGAKAESLAVASAQGYLAALGAMQGRDSVPSYILGSSLTGFGDAVRQVAVYRTGAQADSMTRTALNAYGHAAGIFTRARLPQEWAWTQVGTASALADLSSRSSRPEAVRLLEKSIELFRLALEEVGDESPPTSLESLRLGLGNAMVSLAMYQRSDSAVALLNQALLTFGATTDARARTRNPLLWASAQQSLAFAHLELGRHGDPVGADTCWRKALLAFRQAETVYTREGMPLFWASLQTNAAATLIRHSRITPEPEAMRMLAEAESVIRSALEVSVNAQERSVNEFNLGIIATMRGDYAGAATAFERARRDMPAHHRAELAVALEAVTLASALLRGDPGAVPERLGRIISLVAEQEPDFHVEQSLRGAELFIQGNGALSPHQGWLRTFFSAFQAADRDAILAGLREAQRSFGTRDPAAG